MVLGTMKKWIIGIALFAVVMALLSGLFVNSKLHKMYGGYTKLAKVGLPNDHAQSYALTHVNVLTPPADEFVTDQTVLIDDGEVASVGANNKLPTGIKTIDGKGMFLVPGYTDSHVHLWESENDLLLYIANGITQIREMNGSKQHLRWKQEIEKGRIGPDMFVVSPQLATFGLIEGWFVGWTQRKVIVRSDEDVERAVQTFKDEGYDAVKASSFLSKEAYVKLSEATKEKSLPLIGHIPLDAGLNYLWRSNQIEVAHVEELMKALRDEFLGYTSDNADEFLDYVRSRSDAVADQLIAKGISVTSTLSLIDSFYRLKVDLKEVLNASQLQFANPGITEGTIITSHGMGWLPDVNIYRWPDEWDKKQRRKSLIYWKAYSKAQHIVFEALLKKGVPVMAGTDANVPVTVPGFSLHDEMRALNDAGMTRAQVLASATSVPAKWMKMKTGQIRPGYKANSCC